MRRTGDSCRAPAGPTELRRRARWSGRSRYLRESFFYGRTFVSDADLNEQATRWLEGTANVRRHGTTGERPVDRFERAERDALGPLAGRPYRRLGATQAAAPAPRPRPAVEVQQRALADYAEAVR